MRIKRIVVAVVGLAVLGGACGDSSGGTNPLATIVLAADKTHEAGSARIFMNMQMEAPNGRMTTTGEGAVDMATKQGEMTMEMEMPDAPAGTPDLGTTEAIFEGTTIYMKMPALSAQLPPGKPWVSFDLQKVGEQLGMDLGALMQAGGSDPSQSLQYLRGASGEVETVGEEEVRGAPATHYKATIVFDKVVSEAPEDLQDAIEPTIDILREWLGADQMPIDVWIDDEGRMVRQQQSFDYEAGPAQGTSVSMTMEMFDFGTEVDVEPPSPSEVTDLGELMNEMGQPTSP